jgi:hypothetical protein
MRYSHPIRIEHAMLREYARGVRATPPELSAWQAHTRGVALAARVGHVPLGLLPEYLTAERRRDLAARRPRPLFASLREELRWGAMVTVGGRLPNYAERAAISLPLSATLGRRWSHRAHARAEASCRARPARCFWSHYVVPPSLALAIYRGARFVDDDGRAYVRVPTGRSYTADGRVFFSRSYTAVVGTTAYRVRASRGYRAVCTVEDVAVAATATLDRLESLLAHATRRTRVDRAARVREQAALVAASVPTLAERARDLVARAETTLAAVLGGTASSVEVAS